MAYEALARKYRPRTFDELVGQRPIVRTLTNAIKAGRIHHAYVFSGVRGVGKTTIARVFAKALNCEKGPTPTPCLACAPCLEIAAGQDMDVIEMDAASRTGVDDVRDLIDTTRYAPARDRYKVFIIDEFHMLSRPAFNALLKTLEEPPPRVVFVMATTELHKVPSTVLSRTQQFDFRKVPVGEIAELLARIAKEEKINAPRTCLEMLARAGDGSVRDAESLLDQAIASCGNDLNEDDLRAILGLVPDETVEAFFAAATERDACGMLRLIDAALSEGHDLRIFLGGLIEGVRRLLLIRTLDRPSEILGLSADHEARLAALAGRFETVTLLRISSLLMGLEGPLKYSDQPRYLFEAAAIRLATITDLVPIEDLIARLGLGGAGGPAGGAGGGPKAGSPGTAKTSAVPAPSRMAGARPAPPKTTRSGPQDPHQPAETREEHAAGTKRRIAGVPTGHAHDGRMGEIQDQPAAHAHDGRPGGMKSGRSGNAHDGLPGDVQDRPIGDEHDGRTGHVQDRPTGDALDGPTGQMHDGRGFVEQFVDAVHARRMPLAILVDQASSIDFDGDRIVLLFEDTNAFARKSVEQPANVAILENVAAGILGREVAFVIARSADLQSAPSSSTAGGPEEDTGFESAGAPDTAGQLEAASPRRATPATSENPRARVSRELGEKPGRGSRRTEGIAPQEAGPAGSMDEGIGLDEGGGGLDVSIGTGAEEHAHTAAAEAKRRRLLVEAAEDPVIKNILERFEGRIVEVKEVS